MNLFTYGHVLKIAEALSKQEEDSYINAIRNIADMLQADNPEFDRTNFLHLTAKPAEQFSELGKLFG